jgi:hypothetical protein
MVPPPEPEPDPDNLPPTLEWNLAVPQSFWWLHNKTKSAPGEAPDTLSFDITQAVSDPEGDRLSYIWYWSTGSKDDKTLRPEYARNTMSLRPCEQVPLQLAESVQVVVVVSDRELTWIGGTKDSGQPVEVVPLEGEDPLDAAQRLAYRSWHVYFTNPAGCL